MDYAKIYDKFIADRKSKLKPEGYTERHHIVPRSLGGGNEPENLIDLTTEDHIFAHLLLAKIHGGKMWYPLVIMLKPAKHIGISCKGGRARRIAAMAKREQSRVQTGVKRPDVSRALKGMVRSQAHCDAISAAKIGFKDSNETRQKKSEASKGRIFSKERNAKIAAARLGKSLSDKTKAKISEKAKINNSGKGNPRFNHTVYAFAHSDGTVVYSTKFELAKKYKLNRTCLNYVVNGKRAQTKGWRLAS
jgi:hypothetical protein